MPKNPERLIIWLKRSPDDRKREKVVVTPETTLRELVDALGNQTAATIESLSYVGPRSPEQLREDWLDAANKNLTDKGFEEWCAQQSEMNWPSSATLRKT
jgi:hypothetical protein